MAALLADGVSQLTAAFERLSQNRPGSDDATATAAADAAVKTQRQVERVYRKAASALLTVDDSARSSAAASCTGASPASARR
jgi:hypothetical protein